MASNPRLIIAKIDRQIDAVRATLLSKVKVDRLSAASWQSAWDKFPALQKRDNQLFRRRGIAQQARDMADARKSAKARRQVASRKHRCPTFGVASYQQAA